MVSPSVLVVPGLPQFGSEAGAVVIDGAPRKTFFNVADTIVR